MISHGFLGAAWLTRNINVWKLILYKRMLLLKKKKYAAVKVQFKDGTPYELQLPACHYIAMPSIWLFIVTGACYQRNWETFVSIKYNLKDSAPQCCMLDNLNEVNHGASKGQPYIMDFWCS